MNNIFRESAEPFIFSAIQIYNSTNDLINEIRSVQF